MPQRYRDIVIIAIRLIALYQIVVAVRSMPSQIHSFFAFPAMDPTSVAVVRSGFISSGTHLLVALLLWFFSSRLANMVWEGQDDNMPIPDGFSLSEIQVTAISILGLAILSDAIPSLFNLIITNIFPKSNPRYVYTLEMSGKFEAQIPIADYASVGIKILFGLWFLLGSHGIVNAVTKLWQKGKNL